MHFYFKFSREYLYPPIYTRFWDLPTWCFWWIFFLFQAAVLWETTVSAVTETQMTSKPVAVTMKKSSVNPTKKVVIQSTRLSEGEYDIGDDDFDDNFNDDSVLIEPMITAAKAMTVNDEVMARQLEKALRKMDETDKAEADVADHMFDTYVELYPAWLAYVQATEPAIRESKFSEYQELLKEYEKAQESMVNILLELILLQKTLLPSNVLLDPENRINSTLNIANELKVLDEP